MCSFHSTQDARNRLRLSFAPIVGIDGALHWILLSGNKVALQMGIVDREEFGAVVAGRESALLYRELARLRFDVPLAETLDDLCWLGAHEGALGNLPDPDADLWRTRARTLARQKA
jgi:hypothetical protein